VTRGECGSFASGARLTRPGGLAWLDVIELGAYTV